MQTFETILELDDRATKWPMQFHIVLNYNVIGFHMPTDLVWTGVMRQCHAKDVQPCERCATTALQQTSFFRCWELASSMLGPQNAEKLNRRPERNTNISIRLLAAVNNRIPTRSPGTPCQWRWKSNCSLDVFTQFMCCLCSRKNFWGYYFNHTRVCVIQTSRILATNVQNWKLLGYSFSVIWARFHR